ncbi:MAG TPA: ABC transporter substrate-binding protein [Planctomycetota bacterium]|nr:ABC transporter substrate-binding protein [Planctomycetota bacterium]
MKHRPAVLLFLGGALAAACGRGAEASARLRVGHFPNVTHAHALLGHRASRRGEGWFEARLEPGTTVEWLVFNAGPSAMEALLAGTIDLAYVGPNPALNAHLRTGGEEVRVIAGATNGGSGLIVRADGPIRTPLDFWGRRLGTPQFGNTQDVAARAWLTAQGFRVRPTGGEVLVVPTAIPDQQALFEKGDLDAVWTVEPWLSRLEREAGGRLFLEEKDAVTTVLVASARLLRERRPIARAWLRAHADLTRWMGEHRDEMRAALREELEAETTRPIGAGLLEASLERLRFVDDPPRGGFERFVRAAQEAGFLEGPADLSRLVEDVGEDPR